MATASSSSIRVGSFINKRILSRDHSFPLLTFHNDQSFI